MPSIVNVPDFIKIGIMAVLAIWSFNKILSVTGLDSKLNPDA